MSQLFWVKILLKNIGLQVEGHMWIYCDKKVTINLSNNLLFYDWTKHREIVCHFIKDMIDSKELMLSYVETPNQVVDVFIKGIS